LRWLATGRPTNLTNSVALVTGLPKQRRDYVLYLPLYNGVKSVEIGIEKERPFRPSHATAKPRSPLCSGATPIILVEDRTYTDAFLVATRRDRNSTSRAALKAEFDKLTAAGEKRLYYIPGETLLGADGEARSMARIQPIWALFVRQKRWRKS
jgi:hypothetical protein